MGYYTSTYVMFGAEVATERAYRTSEWLENPVANAILHKHKVGYSLSGPYDNDFLFLCRHHQEAEMGTYVRLELPVTQEAEDRAAIKAAAEELGLTLMFEPTWLAVPDVS